MLTKFCIKTLKNSKFLLHSLIKLLLSITGGQMKSRRLSENAPSHPIPKLGNVGRKNSKTNVSTDFLKTPESGMAGYVIMLIFICIYILYLHCCQMHLVLCLFLYFVLLPLISIWILILICSEPDFFYWCAVCLNIDI